MTPIIEEKGRKSEGYEERKYGRDTKNETGTEVDISLNKVNFFVKK